jgi:hypothetical protein
MEAGATSRKQKQPQPSYHHEEESCIENGANMTERSAKRCWKEKLKPQISILTSCGYLSQDDSFIFYFVSCRLGFQQIASKMNVVERLLIFARVLFCQASWP